MISFGLRSAPLVVLDVSVLRTITIATTLCVALAPLATVALSKGPSLNESLPVSSTLGHTKVDWLKRIAASPKDAQLHLDYAEFLLSAGLIDNAIVEFQSAARLKPSDAEPFIALAEIYLQNLDFEKAQSCAGNALKLQPRSSSARIVLLSALVQEDQIADAERELAILLKSAPQNARVLQLAYMVKARLGDFSEARRYLQLAVTLQPAKIDWVLALCKMEENCGNDELALEQLRTILKRYPNSIEARLRLARNLEVFRHDYDGAILEYGWALLIDDKSAVALAGIERCKGKKNNLALRIRQGVQSLLMPQARGN